MPICDTFPWLCLRGWFNKQLPCQKGGPERIHFPALYCLYTTPAAPNWRFPTSFIASNHMAASQSYMKLQYISIHQHTLTIISLSLRLPRFNCSIWSIRCHRCFPNGWNTDICVQWISAVTMASIVSVPRGSVDRWGSMNLWHWNLWNKSGTESIESIAFSKLFSVLIHFEHGRRSLTIASTLGEAARSSDAIRMAAMLLRKQRQAVSAILIHSAILPRGYGSIPINTIFRGMNIHLPAILMFTKSFCCAMLCQVSTFVSSAASVGFTGQTARETRL